MADSTKEDETIEEKQESAGTGATPDETHRIGEFDDIRGRLEKLSGKLDSIYDFIVKNAVKKSDEDNESNDDDESEDDEVTLVPIEDLEL